MASLWVPGPATPMAMAAAEGTAHANGALAAKASTAAAARSGTAVNAALRGSRVLLKLVVPIRAGCSAMAGAAWAATAGSTLPGAVGAGNSSNPATGDVKAAAEATSLDGSAPKALAFSGTPLRKRLLGDWLHEREERGERGDRGGERGEPGEGCDRGEHCWESVRLRERSERVPERRTPAPANTA
mmetsp:Transcript_16779/g.39337  ORF Transcript_16779/g.39337 Transcript_16779/m.39337 type:complete len:186 (+) Transcript_16779:219-776(+)